MTMFSRLSACAAVLGALAVAAIAPASASALTSPSVQINGGGVPWNITCLGSTLATSSTSPTTWSVTGGTFTSCGFGRSMTGSFTTPWTLTVAGSVATLSNMRLTSVIFGMTCVYVGTVSGTYTGTAYVFNSLGLTPQNGGTCASPTFTATYS